MYDHNIHTTFVLELRLLGRSSPGCTHTPELDLPSVADIPKLDRPPLLALAQILGELDLPPANDILELDRPPLLALAQIVGELDLPSAAVIPELELARR
jgi:hypothetical protein